MNLNQTGILMNVIAGILMAPDLIGKKTINAFETKLEAKLGSVEQWFARRVDMKARLMEDSEKEVEIHGGAAFFSLLSPFIGSIIFWWIILGLIEGEMAWGSLKSWYVISIFVISVPVGIGAEVFGNWAEKKTSVGYKLLVALSVCIQMVVIVMIWGIVFSLAIGLLYWLPKGFAVLVRSAVALLGKSETMVLRLMLVFGLLLFIVGNLLQFLASSNEEKYIGPIPGGEGTNSSVVINR